MPRLSFVGFIAAPVRRARLAVRVSETVGDELPRRVLAPRVSLAGATRADRTLAHAHAGVVVVVLLDVLANTTRVAGPAVPIRIATDWTVAQRRVFAPVTGLKSTARAEA